MKPIIHVRNLKKIYTGYKRGQGILEAAKSLIYRKKIQYPALKGIDFDIKPGEIIGFVGPNGAGKSTAIKIMTGVLYPTSGEVEVMDYVPWKDREDYVRNIGALFGQKSQLWWDLPPIDSFYLNQAIYSIPEQTFRKNLKIMAKALEAEDIIHRPTRNLSLGERMKCEFIMAMLHNPPIVFLDEPTIGLDVFAKETIRKFIKQWNQDKGTTFILTTHDMDDIERLAHRIIVIDHGQIVFDDSLDKLKKYLGAKKYVLLICRKKIVPIRQRGVKLSRRMSNTEQEFVIDLDKLSVGEFIRRATKGNQLIDLIVQEPPIEEIIKKVYRGT